MYHQLFYYIKLPYNIGCSHQNFDFPKKSAFIDHLKALTKSFPECACFLNLDELFMR